MGEADIYTVRETNVYFDVFVWKNAIFPDNATELMCRPPRTWKAIRATYDAINGQAHATDGDNEWYFSSLEGSHMYSIVANMNEQLRDMDAGAQVWAVDTDPDAKGETLFPIGTKIPSVGNEHVRANVTGFAMQGYEALVAVNMITYKGTYDSLVATARQGKKLYMSDMPAGFGGGARSFPSKEIKIIATNVTEINLTHAGIFAREACPGLYKPGDKYVYILVFGDDPEEELLTKFYGALDSMLVHPIRPEWAGKILSVAKSTGFVRGLETGGDIKGGIAIAVERNWDVLLSNMLSTKQIKLEKETA